MKTTAVSFMLLGSALLAGCGGGGGGSSPAPAPVPPTSTGPTGPVVQLEAAVKQLYTVDQDFGHDATDANGAPVKLIRTYRVGKTQPPGQPTPPDVTSAKFIGINNTINNSSGIVTRSFGQTDYFQGDANTSYKLLARTFTTSPFYEVASNQQVLPVTAKAGDSGKFYDSVTYSSTTKQTVVANSSVSWEVKPDSDTSLSFCINSTTTPVGVAAVTNSDCYVISTPGKITTVNFKG